MNLNPTTTATSLLGSLQAGTDVQRLGDPAAPGGPSAFLRELHQAEQRGATPAPVAPQAAPKDPPAPRRQEAGDATGDARNDRPQDGDPDDAGATEAAHDPQRQAGTPGAAGKGWRGARVRAGADTAGAAAASGWRAPHGGRDAAAQPGATDPNAAASAEPAALAGDAGGAQAQLAAQQAWLARGGQPAQGSEPTGLAGQGVAAPGGGATAAAAGARHALGSWREAALHRSQATVPAAGETADVASMERAGLLAAGQALSGDAGEAFSLAGAMAQRVAADAGEAASPAFTLTATGAAGSAQVGFGAAADGAARPEAGAYSGSIDPPVDSPAFAPALGLRLAVLARDGVQEARLSLHPADMGPVQVQIALEGTAARVDFQADVAATRAALESALPALAGALQQAGLTLAGGGVFQQAREGGAQGQPADAPRGGRAPRAGEADTAAVAAAERRFSPRGLVDLLA
jgi:hypothetical protein